LGYNLPLSLFAFDFEFVSDFAVYLVVFRDASVDADSFAFAEVALRVPSDTLVLA